MSDGRNNPHFYADHDLGIDELPLTIDLRPFYTSRRHRSKRKKTSAYTSPEILKRKLKEMCPEKSEQELALDGFGLRRTKNTRVEPEVIEVKAEQAAAIVAAEPSKSIPMALREVGLSDRQSYKAANQDVVRTKLVEAYEKAGISEDDIAKVIKEGLSATQISRKYDRDGSLVDENEDPDYKTRLAYAQEARTVIAPDDGKAQPGETWLTLTKRMA